MKTALATPVWMATAALSLGSSSCFFELPPLEPYPLGIGGSSGQGGGGSPAEQGGSDGAGAAGAASAGCTNDQKLCSDNQCRPISAEFGCSSSTCERCAGVPNAQMGCIDGVCAVLGCEPGYVDCDGDTLNTGAQSSGTGCEYQLGTPAASVTQLDVPFKSITVDGEREDWSGLPSYTFDQVCANCEDNQTELISAGGTVPPRDDLDAQFRVAWDADKLYLLVEAFDNQPFQAAVTQGRCQSTAECEDGLQVFLLGREDRSHGYFNDNKRIFIGLSERVGAPSQQLPDASDVEIKTERQGNRCYRLEAQLDWEYITSIQNNGPAPGHFPPAPGQSYGFDIAVNDWDAPVSDPSGIQRQSQIFWLDPGDDYASAPTGIGTMTLLGGSDAGG